MWGNIYLSIYPSIYPSIHLSICPSVHLSIYPSIHLSIYPSIHLFIYPSIYPSIHLLVMMVDVFSSKLRLNQESWNISYERWLTLVVIMTWLSHLPLARHDKGRAQKISKKCNLRAWTIDLQKPATQKKPGAFFRQILTQSAMHVRLFGMIIQISFPSKFRMPSPLSGLPHLYMVYKVTNYHLVI